MDEAELRALVLKISHDLNTNALFDGPFFRDFVVRFDPEGTWSKLFGVSTLKLHAAKIFGYVLLLLSEEDVGQHPEIRYRREQHASFYTSAGGEERVIAIPPTLFYGMTHALCETIVLFYTLSSEVESDLRMILVSIANLMVLEHL